MYLNTRSQNDKVKYHNFQINLELKKSVLLKKNKTGIEYGSEAFNLTAKENANLIERIATVVIIMKIRLHNI